MLSVATGVFEQKEDCVMRTQEYCIPNYDCISQATDELSNGLIPIASMGTETDDLVLPRGERHIPIWYVSTVTYPVDAAWIILVFNKNSAMLLTCNRNAMKTV